MNPATKKTDLLELAEELDKQFPKIKACSIAVAHVLRDTTDTPGAGMMGCALALMGLIETMVADLGQNENPRELGKMFIDWAADVIENTMKQQKGRAQA